MRVIWQSFVDDGVVQQSKLSDNAHEAPSRSGIELNTVKEDTLPALTSLGKNAKIEKDRNNRVRGVRHFNQGRGRCIDNDQRGKSDRHPRNAANAIEGTALVAKVGVAAKTTNADQTEWNNTCTEMGDAQLTRTTSGIISLERNDIRRTVKAANMQHLSVMRASANFLRIIGAFPSGMPCLHRNGDRQVHADGVRSNPQVNCLYETNDYLGK